MIGKIVEVEGKEGLFVVVKEKNYEDLGSCSYERDYWLYPYDSSFADDIVVSVNDTMKYSLRGTTNTIKVREDKKSYNQYGFSNIRGVEKIHLERIWEEVIVPGR